MPMYVLCPKCHGQRTIACPACSGRGGRSFSGVIIVSAHNATEAVDVAARFVAVQRKLSQT